MWSGVGGAYVWPRRRGEAHSAVTTRLLWNGVCLTTASTPVATHRVRTSLGRVRRDVTVGSRSTGRTRRTGSTAFIDGLPVTSLIRTSIDMSATRSPRAALVFMGVAMRRAVELESGEANLRMAVLNPATRARLFSQWDAAVAPYSRHRWVTQVRLAIRRADPAAETVLESLSRAAMIEADLPRPRCGAPVVGDDGKTYRADALWDDVGLIGEADGLGKYTDVGRLVAEKRRQEALEANGYKFVRWGMAEVMPDPAVMIMRIRRALDDARRDASERRYRPLLGA